jgi:tripartite-type tricarboxylate transporter receptor subunit TctC
MKRRTFVKLASLAAGGLTLSGLHPSGDLWAEGKYPDRRVNWIVPVKPGGSFDTIARFLSPQVAQAFQVSGAKGGGIILKNVPEAGGRRAYTNIFNAKPDGYTFGDFNLGFITENISSKPDFDVMKFTYLLRTGVSIRVIATKKDGFKNWKEMMNAANTKELKWAAGNYGRGAHIDSILAKETMGIPAKLINFSGTADSISAIIRGDVQVGLFSLDSIFSLLKAGEFKLLMIFDEKSEYPGVPSVKELGYPELSETIRYQRYIVGPPGMPRQIVEAINSVFKKVLTTKETIAWAERMEYPLLPLYGKESEVVAKNVMNFYIKMMPTLSKYIN